MAWAGPSRRRLRGLERQPTLTEKILNHVSGTVSGVATVYNRHSYIEEMRSAIYDY